jgi:gliding motility-associated-like protein
MKRIFNKNTLTYPLSIGLFLLCWMPLKGQFHFNGNAKQVSERCYRLTEAQNGLVGSIWDTVKIDLRQSFDVNLDLFFGCKDADGADGIVFGFQPVSTSIGAQGEGMGFLGVNPSIGIEMDTYQNTNRNDPSFDHIAIIRNGDVNHGTVNTLAGPIALGAGGNIEDCKSHNIRVVWAADSFKLSVFIDCEPKLTYKGDIVKEIFNNDPFVFWGFTSATGGLNNIHEVCFRFTTLLDKPSRVNLCKGDTVQLQAYGGERYRWTPTRGLSNPNIANPIASPDESTTYKVVATDKCGVSFEKEISLAVNGDPILFELGRDTTLCSGENVTLNVSGRGARTYLWQDGSRDSVRQIGQSGIYKATLQRGNCLATDSIKIRFISLPSVALGNDTTVCEAAILKLQVSGENATYRWLDGQNKSIYYIYGSGNYAVTVSNICGEATDDITVTYTDCQRVYIPTAFTPNTDGANDAFTLYDGGNIANIKSLRIFNRWGEQLFEARNIPPNDPSVGWNGRYKNRLLPSDTYAFWAEIEFKDGTSTIKKGDITLIR